MEVKKSPPRQSKKGTKENKTAVVAIRLTPVEKALMQAKAKEAGLNNNEFFRRAALDLEVKQRLPAELQKVVSSVSKNLNQLTKLAHMGRLEGVDEATLGSIIQALNQALR